MNRDPEEVAPGIFHKLLSELHQQKRYEQGHQPENQRESAMQDKSAGMTSRYHQVYAGWKGDPEGFWREAAADLAWIKAPETIFDGSAGVYGRWFTDGVCNTSQNCLDRHIAAGRGEQPAIVYDSPISNTQRTLTYSELLREVELLGHAMKRFGVGKGDVVII